MVFRFLAVEFGLNNFFSIFDLQVSIDSIGSRYINQSLFTSPLSLWLLSLPAPAHGS